MCKAVVKGNYDDHFAECEKVGVVSVCSLCGYEDHLGQVLIHELDCVARRLCTKEEILAMQHGDEEMNLPSLTSARFTKSIVGEFEGNLLDALTTQQVRLPFCQNNPFAPCFSGFLIKKPTYALNLCLQTVLINFLTTPLEGLTHTYFEFKEVSAVVEYQQCHSARSLISGEKPCWFQSDGRTLSNMKPGEH